MIKDNVTYDKTIRREWIRNVEKIDMSTKIKQVIVIRYKYPDEKGGTFSLRLGKFIAQASHASMAFLIERFVNSLRLTSVMQRWLEEGHAKICCRVDTEEELLDIYQKSREAGLETHLITDLGLTEFKGKPTNTVVAIGPDLSEKIDPITGGLKLL